MAVQNISFSYAFLQPLWLILIFCGVILLEASIYFLVTRDKMISIRISFIANIITVLVPIPLFLIPIFSRITIMQREQILVMGGSDYYSFWLIPIIFGFTLVKPLPTPPPYEYRVIVGDYFWTFILFCVTCIISIIIEYFYYKSKILNFTGLNKSNISMFQQVSIANIFSYSVILLGLVTIGLLVGFSKEIDPLVGTSWLFYTLNGGNINIFLISIFLILVFILISYRLLVSALQQGRIKEFIHKI